MGQCILQNQAGGGTMEIFTIGANTQFYKGLATYINSKGEFKSSFFGTKNRAEIITPWCKFSYNSRAITLLKDGVYSVTGGTVDVDHNGHITKDIIKQKMVSGEQIKLNATAYGGDGLTIIKHI